MRSTAFHANAVSTEVLDEVRGMNETVRQTLMMMQAENESLQTNQSRISPESANFAQSNSNESTSEILLFLKNYRKKSKP